MKPTFDEINEVAIQPYTNDEMTQMEAFSAASIPLKEFMIRQTSDKDLIYFMDMAVLQSLASTENLPLYVSVPSFGKSELRIAFQNGIMIYIHYFVIDFVVSSILL